MKFPFFLLSWHMDRSGKGRQPILRAFLRAVLAEIWWNNHLRNLKRRTKILDKFRTLSDEKTIPGKYLSVKINGKRKP